MALWPGLKAKGLGKITELRLNTKRVQDLVQEVLVDGDMRRKVLDAVGELLDFTPFTSDREEGGRRSGRLTWPPGLSDFNDFA